MNQIRWCHLMYIVYIMFGASVFAMDIPARIQQLDTHLVQFASQIGAAWRGVDPLTREPYSRKHLTSLWNQCLWCAEHIDRYCAGKHWAAYDEANASLCLDDYSKILRSHAIRKAVHAPIFSAQELLCIMKATGDKQSRYAFDIDLPCGIARYVFPVARLRADIRDAYQRMVACSNNKSYEQDILEHVRVQLVAIDTSTVQALQRDHSVHRQDAYEVVCSGCREMGIPQEYVIPPCWQSDEE